MVITDCTKHYVNVVSLSLSEYFIVLYSPFFFGCETIKSIKLRTSLFSLQGVSTWGLLRGPSQWQQRSSRTLGTSVTKIRVTWTRALWHSGSRPDNRVTTTYHALCSVETLEKEWFRSARDEGLARFHQILRTARNLKHMNCLFLDSPFSIFWLRFTVGNLNHGKRNYR